MPLLSTFAVFAVGFFMRPIGGLLMGAGADRRGRRAALRALDDSFGTLLLVQCAGIGFPYSLTVALFGGTAPYIGTLFKDIGQAGLFPVYVAVLCLVSSAVYLRLPETAHRPLER